MTEVLDAMEVVEDVVDFNNKPDSQEFEVSIITHEFTFFIMRLFY